MAEDDPFDSSIEEYVATILTCRCGCWFDSIMDEEDEESWRFRHRACYKKKKVKHEETPGSITVSVIEACPFAHEVVEGVHLIDGHGAEWFVRCNDCWAEGPGVNKSDTNGAQLASEKWNARRKV